MFFHSLSLEPQRTGKKIIPSSLQEPGRLASTPVPALPSGANLGTVFKPLCLRLLICEREITEPTPQGCGGAQLTRDCLELLLAYNNHPKMSSYYHHRCYDDDYYENLFPNVGKRRQDRMKWNFRARMVLKVFWVYFILGSVRQKQLLRNQR